MMSSDDSGISTALMAIPGEPVVDAEGAEQIRARIAKGLAGTFFFETDDRRAAARSSARARRVRRRAHGDAYGVDASFRDRPGNHMRLTEVP